MGDREHLSFASFFWYTQAPRVAFMLGALTAGTAV
jgi:hypothetical protein